MSGKPVPRSPLVRYIETSFTPRETIGRYVFLLPPDPVPIKRR